MQVRLDQLLLIKRNRRFSPLLHKRLKVRGEVSVRFPKPIRKLKQPHRPIGVLYLDEKGQLSCCVDRPCADSHPVQRFRPVGTRPSEKAGEGEGRIEKIPPRHALFQQAHRPDWHIGSGGSQPCGSLGHGNPIFHGGDVEAGSILALALRLDAQAVEVGHRDGLAATPKPVGEVEGGLEGTISAPVFRGVLSAPGGYSPEGKRSGDTCSPVGEHILWRVPEPNRPGPLFFEGLAGEPIECLFNSLGVRPVNPFHVAIVASREAEDIVGRGHSGSTIPRQTRKLEVGLPPVPFPRLHFACLPMENDIRDGRIAKDDIHFALRSVAYHRVGDAKGRQTHRPWVNRVGTGPSHAPSAPQPLLVGVVLRSIVNQSLIEVEHERVERLASPSSRPLAVGEADVLVDADARHGPREREVDDRPAKTCVPDDPVNGSERLS